MRPAVLATVRAVGLSAVLCTFIACDNSGPVAPMGGSSDGGRDAAWSNPVDLGDASDATGGDPEAATDAPVVTIDASAETDADGAPPVVGEDAAADATPAPDLAPDLPGDVPVLAPLPTPAVVFSEIMYHPVHEDALVDHHEFLEIHNRAQVALDLSGWQVMGDVSFTFPPGAMIPPGGYRLVVKDAAALLAIPSYGLVATDIMGQYIGQLDNGGGTVTLVDPASRLVDTVTFNDDFPWAIGADALGADEPWLPASAHPVLAHQHRGRSLERYAFDRIGNDAANWTTSPLDAPTPAKPNSVSGAPPAVVINQWARGPGAAIIRNSDEVVVHADFSPGPIAEARVEYFIDSLQVRDEPVLSLPLAAGSSGFEARLPPAADNSIVRYRIVGNRGGGAGAEVISPRPTDPFAWHAYFVTPPAASNALAYSIFVEKNDWTRLWDNIDFPTEQRRVDGCQLRDTWDDRVAAVFVHGGQVFDVRLRYQGSRQHRPDSRTIDPTKTTINPLPDRPNPLKALGLSVKFPSYSNFDKRDTVVLNKLTQSCPGLDAAIAERLYGDPRVNVPAPRVKFARVYMNGGYYHYMMDIEHPDSDMMKRYEPKGAVVGDLFKAAGVRAPTGSSGPDVIYDEGPYGWGDMRPLAANPQCPAIAVEERYQATYQRQTYSWADHASLIKLIDDLNTARGSLPDVGALRSFFAQNFDLAKLIDYIAVRNWSEPWDDNFQNYLLYRRQDNRWLMMPWDDDQEFGEWAKGDAGRSFFVGEQGDAHNNRPTGYSTGLWNRLKDGFIKSHRAELVARLRELDKTVLAPQNVKAKMDEAAGLFSQSDANASPAGFACTFASELASLKAFADNRHTAVGLLLP